MIAIWMAIGVPNRTLWIAAFVAVVCTWCWVIQRYAVEPFERHAAIFMITAVAVHGGVSAILARVASRKGADSGRSDRQFSIYHLLIVTTCVALWIAAEHHQCSRIGVWAVVLSYVTLVIPEVSVAIALVWYSFASGTFSRRVIPPFEILLRLLTVVVIVGVGAVLCTQCVSTARLSLSSMFTLSRLVELSLDNMGSSCVRVVIFGLLILPWLLAQKTQVAD